MNNKVAENFKKQASKMRIRVIYFIPLIGMMSVLFILNKIIMEWINLDNSELNKLSKNYLNKRSSLLEYNDPNLFNDEYVKFNTDRAILIQMFQKILMKNYFRYIKIFLFIFFPFVLFLFPWTFYFLVTKKSVNEMLKELN